MIQLELEDRVEHVAGSMVGMLGSCPRPTWSNVERINRTIGWSYELPSYQAYRFTHCLGPLRVEGDRLDEVNLRRAWNLALEVLDADPSP